MAKDAAVSAGSECECDKVDFALWGRMVTMSTNSFPSRLLVLFHCFIVTIFGALHVLGRGGEWSNSQIASRLGDVGADWG